MTDAKETKGKYGALIQKAREPVNQKSVKPDNQIDSLPEDEGNRPNSESASKQKSQNTKKPDNQVTSQPDAGEIPEREVNLCVKVPESLRRHWAANSKLQGVTMTEVIVAALEARFGRPD